MDDRSDLILLLGAIIVFAFLSLNVNGFLVHNTSVQTKTEVQYTGISLAENVIDDARWLSYDSIDKYSGYDKIDSTNVGVFEVKAKINYVNLSNTEQPVGTVTNHKRLEVTVTSQSLAHPITLSYIKNR